MAAQFRALVVVQRLADGTLDLEPPRGTPDHDNWPNHYFLCEESDCPFFRHWVFVTFDDYLDHLNVRNHAQLIPPSSETDEPSPPSQVKQTSPPEDNSTSSSETDSPSSPADQLLLLPTVESPFSPAVRAVDPRLLLLQPQQDSNTNTSEDRSQSGVSADSIATEDQSNRLPDTDDTEETQSSSLPDTDAVEDESQSVAIPKNGAGQDLCCLEPLCSRFKDSFPNAMQLDAHNATKAHRFAAKENAELLASNFSEQEIRTKQQLVREFKCDICVISKHNTNPKKLSCLSSLAAHKNSASHREALNSKKNTQETTETSQGRELRMTGVRRKAQAEAQAEADLDGMASSNTRSRVKKPKYWAGLAY